MKLVMDKDETSVQKLTELLKIKFRLLNKSKNLKKTKSKEYDSDNEDEDKKANGRARSPASLRDDQSLKDSTSAIGSEDASSYQSFLTQIDHHDDTW